MATNNRNDFEHIEGLRLLLAETVSRFRPRASTGADRYAIRSMVDLKEEKDLDALVNTIKGLDDFELIASLVVE